MAPLIGCWIILNAIPLYILKNTHGYFYDSHFTIPTRLKVYYVHDAIHCFTVPAASKLICLSGKNVFYAGDYNFSFLLW